VCLLVDTVAQGAGTERQVIETAKRLNKSRFDVHVCCLEPSAQLDSLSEYCRTATFPATRFHSAQGIRQLTHLRRYLAENSIKVVHAFMNKTAIFAVASSLVSDRIVITSRLNTGYWYTSSQQVLFRMLNLGTNQIMANSEEAKRIAVKAETIDRDKVDVVYQGVDMHVFKPGAGDLSASERLGIPPAALVIGIVANLRPVKDIPLFLRAAELVAREVKDIAFVVAGAGGQLAELEHMASGAGLQRKVFFTRGRGRVVDYLARMSIGCSTSLSEGFSNAILEYMAMGLPVVATDVGGNREAIVDGETGYLVRDRLPECFANRLLHLIRNEDLRREMGRKGLSRCAENFELGRTISHLEQYYSSLVSTARGNQM
jgi:L-malate glycosyltransferase